MPGVCCIRPAWCNSGAHLADAAIADLQQAQGPAACGLPHLLTDRLPQLSHSRLRGHAHPVALLAHLLSPQVMESDLR